MSIIKPVDGILDRDMAIASAQDLISKKDPYIRDLINYSTNTLVRCENSLRGVSGTPYSLIALFL